MNHQKSRLAFRRFLTTSRTRPCSSSHRRVRCDSGAKFAFKVTTTWRAPRKQLQISRKIRILAANSQMLLRRFLPIRWSPWMRTSNWGLHLQVDGLLLNRWWSKGRAACKTCHCLQWIRPARERAFDRLQDQGLPEELRSKGKQSRRRMWQPKSLKASS